MSRASGTRANSPDGTDGDLLGHELSGAIIRFHQAVSERLGVSVSEHKLIDELVLRGSATPSELAAALGLSRPAIAKIVGELERRGLVRRVSSETDRRSVVVTVADELRERTGELYAPLVIGMQNLSRSFTEAEGAAILRWLDGAVAILRDEIARLSP